MDIVKTFKKRSKREGEASSSASRKKKARKHKRREETPQRLVDEPSRGSPEPEGEEAGKDDGEAETRVLARGPPQEETEGRGGRQGKIPFDSLHFSEWLFKTAAERVDYGDMVNYHKRDAAQAIRNSALQIALQSQILEEDVVKISSEAAELSGALEDAKQKCEQLTVLVGKEQSQREQLVTELAKAKEEVAKAETLRDEERRKKEDAIEAAEVAEAKIRSEYGKGGERRAVIEEEVRKSGAFKTQAYTTGMKLYGVALDDAEAKIPDRPEVFAELREAIRKQMENMEPFHSGDEEEESGGSSGGEESTDEGGNDSAGDAQD